jgi:recombination protein RecT
MEQKAPLNPIAIIRNDLNKMEGEFKLALPSSISSDKFIRIAMTAIQNNPDLQGADRKSLIGSCMKAAADGLLPDGREAALVIFKGQVAYMPMLSGILKRIRNAGYIKTVSAQIIHAKDKFRYWIDNSGENVNFDPLIFGEDRGEIIGAFAVATTNEGAIYVEVMPKNEIEKVRNVSRAKNSGPWTTWWDEMAKKTVIRRLSKRLPISSDVAEIMKRDDEFFEMSNEPANDTPVEIKSVKDVETTIVNSTEAPVETAPTEKPVEQKQESAPEAPKQEEQKMFTRAELSVEIVRLSQQLGWTKPQISEYAKTHFNKPSRDLTDSEMVDMMMAMTDLLNGEKGEGNE